MTTAPSPAITLTLTAMNTPVPAAKGELRIGLAALEGLEVEEAVGPVLLPLTEETFPVAVPVELEILEAELAPLVGELPPLCEPYRSADWNVVHFDVAGILGSYGMLVMGPSDSGGCV